jgi:putative heme-binding domain-containing protein
LGDDACVADVLLSLPGGDREISDSRLELVARTLEDLGPERRRQLAENDARIRDGVDHAVKLAHEILDGADKNQRQTAAAARIMAACSPNVEKAQDLLRPLLAPQNAPAVQQAAVAVLGAMDSPRAADVLLEEWPGYTPELRSQVLEAILARPALLPRLIEKLVNGEVPPAQIDALRRQQLLTHADAEIRSKAAKAFAGGFDEDRQKVVVEYAAAAHQSGDAARGQQMFTTHCASCHKLGDLGHEVGPDLAALSNRSPLTLIEAIFDPNRALDERYQTYTAFTDDGLAHTGILVRETANSITLLGQQAKEETILRKQIEALRNSGVSLMPLGFEKELSLEGAADLLSFLAASGAPPKSLPGNSPALVRPDADGTLWLMASGAAIFGDQITFETPWQNIGYWHAPSDYITWDVQLDAPGVFDAYLHWACSDDSAGNTAVVEGFAAPLRVKVEGTGGYDKYQTTALGQIKLPAGKCRIVVRPDEPMTAPHLMDLRGIYLVPKGGDPARALAGKCPERTPDAAEAIAGLLQGLRVGTEHEYERIPAIWEQAIAAGRRNDATELGRLLELSLPKLDEPLRDWQAVVIGGGVVNGLSQQGAWPKERVHEFIRAHEVLKARWERLIELAASMADDESVRTGTRYDALRILGADNWERSGAALVRCLAPGVHGELQMGAVSGLADINESASADALVASFVNLDQANRKLAVAALMRTDERILKLIDAIVADTIPASALDREQVASLRQHKNSALRRRAIEALKD